MVSITYLLSGASLLVAVLVAVSNFRRNTSADDKKESEQMTTVIVKLENIGNGVNEIKSDIRNIRSEVMELRERVVVVEQSTKSLHKRVDGFGEQE